MAVPLILGGIAAISAITGVGKGIHAGVQTKEAKEVNSNAQYIYDSAKKNLEKARDDSQKSLETLGKAKIAILDGSISSFITTFEKIHDIDLEDSVGLNELSKFKLDKQSFLKMKEMSNLATSMLGGVVGGGLAGGLMAFGAYSAAMAFGAASTGTAIATLSGIAATNATLAFLGGGSLAIGGLGIAGGTAILGGVVAGPALAVLGIFMDAKAGKNLDNAYSNLAEANKIKAEFEVATTICNGIEKRANMFTDLLGKLDDMFKPLIIKMETIIDVLGCDFREYNKSSKETVGMALSIAGAIKNVIDTPILTESGKLTNESLVISNEVQGLLSGNSSNSNASFTTIKIGDKVKVKNVRWIDGMHRGEDYYGNQFYIFNNSYDVKHIDGDKICIGIDGINIFVKLSNLIRE